MALAKASALSQSMVSSMSTSVPGDVSTISMRPDSSELDRSMAPIGDA